MTDGRGPDAAIDSVGAEAHGHGVLGDAKKRVQLRTTGVSDQPDVLQEMVKCVRKGGTISVPGVYADQASFPIGPFMNKGLTMHAGQTHMQRYLAPLLERVEAGEIDLSGIITHRGDLKDGPDFYKTFRDKDDGCIKCVMKPEEL